MKKEINGLTINYRIRSNKNRDKFVLLLHGWGGSLDSFKATEDFLVANNYSTINIDFPGFGKSDLPKNDFTLKDYKDLVESILKIENINSVSIIAHSFGGRVALMLASENTIVNKLVLVDSAGIKPKFSLRKWFKIKIYKFKKFLNKHFKTKFDLSKYGSQDYKAMPQQLKGVFNNVVNLDLTFCLKNIKCPTLLIWGDKDKSTPLYMAKKMKKKINDCELIIFKNCGHFSYLEKFNNFCLIINKFL